VKVLLVGGSGMVGSFVTPYLRRYHEVRVLDVRPPAYDDIDFVEGSITSVDDLRRGLDGVDAFIDLVMRSPQGGSTTGQSVDVITDNYAVNTLGLHLLLYTAHELGVRRGVYTSTLSVHHRARTQYPAEELVPLDTPSVYGLTKGFGELICGYFARWFDMNLIALRISAPRTRELWLEERRGEPTVFEGVRLFPTDEEDLANAYLGALNAVKVGHGRFDAVFVVGDEREEEHNLSKAERLLGWRPRTHLLPKEENS
jgi:nucleoside-diphosphate-sugar epimerase